MPVLPRRDLFDLKSVLAIFSDDPPHAAKRQWTSIPARERVRKHFFPNVPLITHEGKTVRFYEDLLKGKIVTINMMYANCQGVCVPVTSNLLKVQKLLGDRVGRDIFMYSISLKPAEDTPDRLQHYMEMHGVRPGWTFLTGNPADIELLRQKLGFTDPDPARDADKTNHIGMVRFGNEPLTLWTACPGLSSPEAIAKSIRELSVSGA